METLTLNLYDNREMSWLKFNERVLDEARDMNVPLFERLKFVSIFCSNLDEFYMVRVGSLYDQMILKNQKKDTKWRLSPKSQLELIFSKTATLMPEKDAVYENLKREFQEKGLTHLNYKNLTQDEFDELKQYFKQEVYPLLSPQVIDKKQPFPFFNNKEIYVAVQIRTKKNSVKIGVVPATGGHFERVVFLKNRSAFILVEELIALFITDIFSQYRIIDKTIFRITRNADIDLDAAIYDEELDYRKIMSTLLKKRKRLAPVRLQIQESINPGMKEYLCHALELKPAQVFIESTPLDFSFVSQLEKGIVKDRVSEWFYKELVPQQTPKIAQNIPVMQQIEQKDVMLFYPFESIDSFTRMLTEAAFDPEVVSIKITLYRVSKDSKIISALIHAAENGKHVVVVVELRARFDEENNIDWSVRLEEAGCTVIYGLDSYKVHSKLLLITRKTDAGVKYITQIGTGNYNEITTRFYTDVSLITANQAIGLDASQVFVSLQMGEVVQGTTDLLVAPTTLKQGIIDLIDEQIARVIDGKEGYIRLKMNSLSDKNLIDKLISAAQSGVKIEMIIRGICCLVSGIQGATQRIQVKSIIGRFLEHSRIFIFGPDEECKIYISSADLMTRNTEKRVEVAAPIYDEEIKQDLIERFRIMWSDNMKCRIQTSAGTYRRVEFSEGEECLDSQMYFYELAYKNSADKQSIKQGGLPLNESATLRQPERSIPVVKDHPSVFKKIKHFFS